MPPCSAGIPSWGKLLAEFAGTFVLVLSCLGVVAQVVATGTGDYNSIAIAWGFAVTLGVYTAARLSGAHLNPAVTLALAVFRGFSWAKVAPYVSVQVAAAFVAALVVRRNYREALAAADPEDRNFGVEADGHPSAPADGAAARKDGRSDGHVAAATDGRSATDA